MTNQLVENLMQSVVEGGFRRTAARRAIMEALVESGGHVTADDLARQVRVANPTVGRMTVYRTLELLCNLGVIRPIYQGTGAAHYVLLERGSHHHLICNRCGITFEFEHCDSAALIQELSDRYKFQIQAHMLEFYGYCAGCQSS